LVQKVYRVIPCFEAGAGHMSRKIAGMKEGKRTWADKNGSFESA
jgi:hypothetical protein